MSETVQHPKYRPPVPGETSSEKARRTRANRLDREARHRYSDALCARCGMVRFHVSHEQDPEHSPEGAAYHADFAHHPFEEASRGR